MANVTTPDGLPSLPQKDDPSRREARAFQLSIARTAYDYTTSYLYPAPLAAQVPAGEGFSIAYKEKVAPALLDIARNLEAVIMSRFEAQIRSELPAVPAPWMTAVQQAVDRAEQQLESGSVLNPFGDMKVIRDLLHAVADGAVQVEAAARKASAIPEQLHNFSTAIEQPLEDMKSIGITAFLKDTMYDVLRTQETGDAYLRATRLEDFAELYAELPAPPQVMNLPAEPWMGLRPDQQVWETDWYFGWLQTAGFNTTNLRGVFPSGKAPAMALDRDLLLAKLPLDDAMLKAASGDAAMTVDRAIELGRLFAVDMAMLDGQASGSLHGDQRYVTAPIAVFYWNPTPAGAGYPQGQGSLQPVAIQLAQKGDPAKYPVFLPGGDATLWKLAKFFVLNALAVHHETIAHFGACHMTLETIIIATHRQLSELHPVLALLTPHFRFTLNINEGAKHSLIIPGGVVASVLSTAIESSLGMVRDARLAWRFDQNLPPSLFSLRGVDTTRLPGFPFRDDTLLLWDATRDFVRAYLSIYYDGDAAVAADPELQAWVEELTSPEGAAFQGFDGLTEVKDAGGRTRLALTRLDYLVDMVSLIIYTAGPQHASVNYAQYPMMSYLPSVSGTAYALPPTATPAADAEVAFRSVLPPLDVALYQLSFGYLLSSVQYDTFGTYSDNPRRPFFKEPRAEAAAIDFRMALAAIEAKIRERNRSRPLPYETQIPSFIPNSISI